MQTLIEYREQRLIKNAFKVSGYTDNNHVTFSFINGMDPALKIINLETSITSHDLPWPGKGINYRMHPGNIRVLTSAGAGIEVYKNKLILYGAGDFINDYEGIGGYEQYRDDLTLMYFPCIDPLNGNLTSMTMVPMQIRNFRLNQASVSDAGWLCNTLNRESRKFGTGITIDENRHLSLLWN